MQGVGFGPIRTFVAVIAGLVPAIHDAVRPAMADYWVYILTNRPRSTLYVGVTNNLVRRVYEHREGTVPGFTKRYGLTMIVYFERYNSPREAIQREKNIKHWQRQWKLNLVGSANPQWRDLYKDITR